MCVTPQSPTSPSAGLRTVNRVYEDAASSGKPCHLTYSSSHLSRRSDKLQPTDPTFEAGKSGRGLQQRAEEKARCEMPSSWTIAALDTTPPPEPVPSRELWSLSGFMTSALESTWLNLMAFIMFQGIVCLLCVHGGPTVVHRLAEVTPRILGRRLKRKGESGDSKAGTPAAHADVDPPISVAQSWTLGALYERYVRAREDSNLREAGDVLGRARPLTEVGTRGRLLRIENMHCCREHDLLQVGGLRSYSGILSSRTIGQGDTSRLFVLPLRIAAVSGYQKQQEDTKWWRFFYVGPAKKDEHASYTSLIEDLHSSLSKCASFCRS